ncbi:Protocadherin wing polarity protein stan [Fasciola gigantica]|uniref:Protocadherin wing polarity protein stan n=1 Tax=Fasciola gigantica TaxID=46835 RepID=A0A504YNA6_FASGI|nr:Protocadherin wing polarity protein stan [Fasciola gigantica]
MEFLAYDLKTWSRKFSALFILTLGCPSLGPFVVQLSSASISNNIFWIEENLAKGSSIGQMSSSFGRDRLELRSVVYTSLAQDVVAQYFRVDPADGTIYAAEVIDRESLCGDSVFGQPEIGTDYMVRRFRSVRSIRSLEKRVLMDETRHQQTHSSNKSNLVMKPDQLRPQRAVDIFSGSHQTASTTCRVKFQVHIGLTLIDGTSDSLIQDVQIMIADVNDNKPVFSSDLYVLQVLESSPIDAEFQLPAAHDPDSGMHGITLYKIDRIQMLQDGLPSSNSLCQVTSSTEIKMSEVGKNTHKKPRRYPYAGDYFVLHATRHANGRLQPQLKQIRQLDREQVDNLYLCLIAQDGGANQGTLFVRIELADANDNVPQWRGLPYKVTISECDPIDQYGGARRAGAGSSASSASVGGALNVHRTNSHLNPSDSTLRHLITLEADDPDLGANGQCSFRLGQQASPEVMKHLTRAQLPDFIVKENQVFLASKLDYETMPQFFVPVEVVDGGGLVNYTEIEVNVEDCNDHAPVITVIPLSAPKFGPNRNMSSDWIPTGFSSAGLSRPMLSQETSLWLEEEFTSRIDLATIMAQDKDKTDVGQITCRLEHHRLAPPQTSFFELIPLDGSTVGTQPHIQGGTKKAVAMFTLYKRDGLKVDREKVTSIVLSIVCTDNGSIRSHETSKLIHIYISDINDNAPIIASFDFNTNDRISPYITQTMSVPENQPFGTLVGRIKATDPDEGQNAHLTYTFIQPPYPSNWTQMTDIPLGQTISELFELESSTGKLFTQVPLDRETNSSYIAYVKVTDGGTPSLTSIVRVHILVSDINDNPPRFVATEGVSGRIVFHTTESDGERSVHGRLIGQLVAHDEDFGRNQTIKFSLVEGSVSPSGLPVTYRVTNEGKIYVDGLLDREQCSQHQLTVRAVDGGPAGYQLTASAMVIVHIDDVNDSPPQFVQPPTISNSGIPSDLINVTVNTPPGSVVYRIQAIDMDQTTNTKLHFVLRSAKFLANYFTLRPTENALAKSNGISEAGADLILVSPLTELPAVQLTNSDTSYPAPKEYFIYVIVRDSDTEPNHSVTARLRIHIYQERPLMHHPTSINSPEGQLNRNHSSDSSTSDYVTDSLKLQHRSSMVDMVRGDSTEENKVNSRTHSSYRYQKNSSIAVLLILAIVIICVFLGIFCFVAFLYLRGTQRRHTSDPSPTGSATNPCKSSMLTVNGNVTGHGTLGTLPPESEDVEHMAYWDLLNQNCESDIWGREKVFDCSGGFTP